MSQECRKHKLLANVALFDIPIAEIKTHLRIFDDDEDAYLGRLLASATSLASVYIGEYLFDARVEAFFNSFEDAVLPHAYVLRVESVAYFNAIDATVLLPTSAYYFDDTGLEPIVKFTTSPSLSTKYENPLSITYISRIDGSDLFEDAKKQAVLSIIADLYRFREGLPVKVETKTLLFVQRLLSPFARFVL